MVEPVVPPIDDSSLSTNADGGMASARAACCDSCGRYVGSYERCPYCGARMVGRVTVRAVKVAAVLFATVGLMLLWWLARHTEIPLISIREASGNMNLAYVRLTGRVARQPTYDPAGGYLGFWLVEAAGVPDDPEPGGVAEIHVNIYRDVLGDLLALGSVPALGDEVSVAGTLRVREGHVALTVNAAEQLDLDRPAARPRTIGEVTPADEGRRVRLTGEVRRITRPYEGLTLVTLGADGDEIVVAVDDVVTALTGPLPELVVGQSVQVDGVVTLYRSAPQIAPASVVDIELLPPPAALGALEPVESAMTPTPVAAATLPASETIADAQAGGLTPTPTGGPPDPTSESEPTSAPTATATIPIVNLSQLDAEDVGRWVRVRGQVVLLEGIKGGVKATLDDGTAQVILLLWDNVHHALERPAAVDAGAEVDATGKLAIYEGLLEVVPTDVDDVMIVSPAPPAAWVEIGALGFGDAGRVVRIRGVIGVPEPFSAGVKVPFDDGTGVIRVLLWSNLLETLVPAPRAGQQVEVVGTVNLFREELELIPRMIYDWRVGPPNG